MADLDDYFKYENDLRVRYSKMFGEPPPVDLSTVYSDNPFPSNDDIEKAIRTETRIAITPFNEINDPTVRV
jgi:hypothetical protein